MPFFIEYCNPVRRIVRRFIATSFCCSGSHQFVRTFTENQSPDWRLVFYFLIRPLEIIAYITRTGKRRSRRSDFYLPQISQYTVRLAVHRILKIAKLYVSQIRVYAPKRQLPIQAELIINRLRMEASIERQRAVSEIDDDAPHVPSYEPLESPQSRRIETHVS